MADLFGKVKDSVSHGAKLLNIKSQEMLLVKRVHRQLRLLRQQRYFALPELGEVVYKVFVQNGFDEVKIRSKCELIAQLDSQIREKESELNRIHLKAQEALGKLFCTMCGTELPRGAKFCSECGSKRI